LRIEECFLKNGGEVDFGIWQRRTPKSFRISLRWNEEKQQYEVYKHYFRLNVDEVAFSSQNLRLAVEFACDIANNYAEQVYGAPIYKDIVIKAKQKKEK